MNTSSPLPISVIIVAKNEEKNLPRCLDSIAGWVSEIIVLLNNSTDQSEAIARRYGARIEHDSWRGFRDTKNIALSHATQPWVLNLDADEEVSDALRRDIHAFFTAPDHNHYAGASFPRKVHFLGRWITHGDWYPDRCLRLFLREKGRFGGGYGHDKVELQGQEKRFHSDLHHYPFPTTKSHIAKINPFADAFLQQQLDAKKKWSLTATLLRPAWRFFRAYFLRRGFLDGFPGFYAAAATAFGAFIRYSRLYEHEHQETPRHGR